MMGWCVMKHKFSIWCILLTILLVSCASASAARERSYGSADVTYSEPIANLGFRLNMDTAETEFAKYFFEPAVSAAERELCIESTDLLLSACSPEAAFPEIYIFSQERYACKYITDHRLYSSVQNWKSTEYAADVLLAAYGASTHYGAAYGYASYLTACTDQPASKFSQPTVDAIYDLNFLCFQEAFTSAEDIAAAKEIACDFAVSYIEQHNEQAFRQLLTSHFASGDALAAYYRENGVCYAPSPVQYGYGGKAYDYIVFSNYGTFYVEKDWADIHAACNPLVSDGFLHTNYADIKAFFEINLKQMKQYRELFKLNSDDYALDIVFSKPLNISKSSFYQSANHRIYLYNVDSFTHEYIHSLSQPSAKMPNWKAEGFARYFSYYYDLYGTAFLNYDYNNTPDIPQTKYIHEYLAAVGRPIDMAIDYREIENLAVYYFDFYDPNANYLAGSSFIQYLVKQYGEAAVVDFVCGDAVPLPKSYHELIKNWRTFIEETYSNYSKYQQP